MQPIEEAILRTIIYADVFDFPLTLDEIHNFLISSEVISLQDIDVALSTSPFLCRVLASLPPYFPLVERTDIVAGRREREAEVDILLAKARQYGEWLSRLPFVRMVAVTGSLAVRNPREHDDLDYFLLVEPGRVWMARAFAILLVRVGRINGVEVCPNYVLAADQLTQRRQDLFIAREISQMVPLYGMAYYDTFRHANRWAEAYQANAARPFYAQETVNEGHWLHIKRLGEWILQGWIGEQFEQWEYGRKQGRFRREMRQHPGGAAEITRERVKGHFSDYGNPALNQYSKRLAQYGLEV